MKRPLRRSLPSVHQAGLEAIRATISANRGGPVLGVRQRVESKGGDFDGLLPKSLLSAFIG
jgi:hypothetical protein